jgi:hypothetical protein
MAFQCGDGGKDVSALTIWSTLERFPRAFYRKPADIPEGWLPVGNVDWLQGAFGRKITPDYYPGWLATILHRKIWQQDTWPLGHRIFVKPADSYKRFTGFVTTGTWKGRKKGPLWCSEPVRFVNEWRYYIQAGSVVAAHWYWGDDGETTPEAPTFPLPIPPDYHGAVDLGTYPDGRLALVEANHPFSCGWYGPLSDGTIYAHWLEAGYNHCKQSMQASAL